jgi:hypothetical protein
MNGDEQVQVTEDLFNSYRQVQAEGVWNMFDPNARLATGLDYTTYLDCIKHYGELTGKYGPFQE